VGGPASYLGGGVRGSIYRAPAGPPGPGLGYLIAGLGGGGGGGGGPGTTTVEPGSTPPAGAEADPYPLRLGGGPITQELSERLFYLSYSFLADLYPSGDAERSPLVYFTGVLGIHRYTLMYRTAYLFTPVLAGFIWIGRLLMLEYALPARAWSSLGWPAKASYKDQGARFKDVRDRYLCRGGFHPMGRMIEMLHYGRGIARKEGSRGMISWSPNKETLQLYN
jgi:hypothetical protein